MKNFIIIIILIVIYTCSAVAQSDEVIVPYDPIIMNKGLKININIGDIEIKGTERKDILVNYKFIKKKEADTDEVSTKGLKRISIRKSKLNITTLDDMIQINDSGFASELKLYVEVPINININTFKGGSGTLLLDNITGNLNLENSSGSIVATNINGLVNASTNEGGIKVGFNSLPDDYAIILANVMGDIEIELPNEKNISFHLKTSNGELLTNLDLQIQETKPTKIAPLGSSEKFTYSNNTWTDAILNAGGPSMTLSSITGNIIIRGR